MKIECDFGSSGTGARRKLLERIVHAGLGGLDDHGSRCSLIDVQDLALAMVLISGSAPPSSSAHFLRGAS